MKTTGIMTLGVGIILTALGLFAQNTSASAKRLGIRSIEERQLIGSDPGCPLNSGVGFSASFYYHLPDGSARMG